jgi:phospholipid/cholesterol/gamma-HCH transport system ATP-binding protein
MNTRSSREQHARRTETTEVMASIRDLRKSFGDLEVLKGVDLDLFKSENLVILGRSGTGKSVLIKCMVGLMKPDSGSITVLGRDVFSLNARELNDLRLQIGFSFQGSALYDSMTVRENLEFPLTRNRGITRRAELGEMVMDALDDVGLAQTVNQMPSELSGGMRKRVGIARTLILKPKIMLYDEPTAGLDPITAMEINDLILSMREKYQMSSIIITHDISSAKHTADRIVALIDGQSRLEGTFEELRHTKDPDLEPFFKY